MVWSTKLSGYPPGNRQVKGGDSGLPRDGQMPTPVPDIQSSGELSGLVCGDAVAILRQLPAKPLFDVIIADPPYNIGKDFGTVSDRLAEAEYLRWSRCWLRLAMRRLKPDGLLYLYGYPEILARLASRLPLGQQRWLVWHYTNKAVPKSGFWQRSHETILCLWRQPGRPPLLEIDQIREPYNPAYLKCAGRTRRNTPSRFGADGRETIYHAHAGGALPRDVLKVPALAGGAGASERWFLCRDCDDKVFPPVMLKAHNGHEIIKHPTQKPAALTRRLLRSRISEDACRQSRVLIPFAGSGAECVVASQLGVDFLGIEINPLYAHFARQWLEQNAWNRAD